MSNLDKIEKIKILRETTNLGYLDCKNALEQSSFDQTEALLLLRTQGKLVSDSKKERKVSEGRVSSYIHGDGRIGVLLQVDCESDFVAKNEHFKQFMLDFSLQIAATNPKFLDKTDVPNETLTKEQAYYRAQAESSKKPANIVEKIVAGQLEKYFASNCLLQQQWVKDPTRKMQDLLHDMIQQTGENIRVTRFARFEAGSI